MEKRYLGDSVYAEIESGTLLLTTNNGEENSNAIYEENSNAIYFEPSVVEALLHFIADMKAEE